MDSTKDNDDDEEEEDIEQLKQGLSNAYGVVFDKNDNNNNNNKRLIEPTDGQDQPTEHPIEQGWSPVFRFYDIPKQFWKESIKQQEETDDKEQ